MADLNPLIRMRRHTVEQKQKVLAALYAEADALDEEKAELERQIIEEGENVSKQNNADLLKYYSSFAESARTRIKAIEAEREKLERRIEVARDDMRAAFADLKKVEITQERREKEERAAEDKKESDMLDEIALEGYRRKMEE